MIVGCCGCIAWGISIPICYYYKLYYDESVTNQSYTCPIQNSLGETVDINDNFLLAMEMQYWVYMGLSILVLFTFCGAYYAHLRLANACCHCIGFFIHMGSIAYLGAIRLSPSGRECSEMEGTPLYIPGLFLKNMFTIQLIAFLIFTCSVCWGTKRAEQFEVPKDPAS